MNAHLDSPGALVSPGDDGNRFKDKCPFNIFLCREKRQDGTCRYTHTHTRKLVHAHMHECAHTRAQTHIDTQTSRHPLAQIIDDISTVTRPKHTDLG